MKALPKTAAKILDTLTAGLSPSGEGDSYRKIDTSNTFMALSVERIGKSTFSIAHYFQSNGDLIQDPEMTFKRSGDGGWYPLTVQHSFGGERIVVELDEAENPIRFSARGYKEASAFAGTWLKNIKRQQDLSTLR